MWDEIVDKEGFIPRIDKKVKLEDKIDKEG